MSPATDQPPDRPPDRPRWLSPDEMRAWRNLVELIGQVHAEQEAALVCAHGITAGEYGVLVVLSEAHDHRLKMCDLAAALHLSPSGLTRRIDGLSKQGLVAREAAPDDRRAVLAALTDAGVAKLESAAPTHVEAVRESLIDHLSADDVRILVEVLDRARAARAGPPS